MRRYCNKVSNEILSQLFYDYREVIFYLNKTYSEKLKSVEAVSKEDLTLINHLSGKTQRYVKLEFTNE